MVEAYSKEIAKEFVLRRLRLTPETLGKTRKDVPSVVRAIGGLQDGGHKIELFNRFQDFNSEWFDYWYENYGLIDGHVLRGALRIVNVDEYLYYFKATRSVARRRASYQRCPLSLNENHYLAFNFIEKNGPLTPSEFKGQFGEKHPALKDAAKKLLYDLYNYGKIARMGRKKQRPLYHIIEKLPYKLNLSKLTEKKAKEWLFTKCLRIYGPLTLKDIAHWVGWRLTETKEILESLLQEKKVTSIKIENDREKHFICVEDLDLIDSLRTALPEYSFIRILFNDDALLLGYYKRLKDYFGYQWQYPQFSEGIVWRAAILFGREIIGEAIVDMSVKSPLYEVKTLILRKKLTDSEILSKIEEEFLRHAEFQNKDLHLKMINQKFI